MLFKFESIKGKRLIIFYNKTKSIFDKIGYNEKGILCDKNIKIF